MSGLKRGFVHKVIIGGFGGWVLSGLRATDATVNEALVDQVGCEGDPSVFVTPPSALAFFLSLGGLLALATGLETLHARPFVASLWGHLVAWWLGAVRVSIAPRPPGHTLCTPCTLYEVSALPAVGFRAVGQTWGEVVLVVYGHASPQLLAHEACHVAQYRRLTSMGFWGLYLGQWLGGLARHRDLFTAYWEVALEAEARRTAEDIKTQNTSPHKPSAQHISNTHAGGL